MTDEERVSKLEKRVRNFNLVVNGVNIEGGFGDLKPGASLEERLANLEKLHDNFRIVGGANTTVEGSFRSGYAICSTCNDGGGVSDNPIVINPPPPSATGACCDGSDCSVITEAACDDIGGDYQGDDTDCDPNPCATGACCTDGVCSVATQADCEGGGGVYQGDDTDCDPNPCPATGACCRDTTCTVETQESCEGDGGVYQGDGTNCDDSPCETPCCNDCFFEHEGIRYLTKTVSLSGECHNAFSPGDCDVAMSSEITIDPDTCLISMVCTGTGGSNGCVATSLTWSDHGGGHCWWYDGATPLTNDIFYPAHCWDYSADACAGVLEDFTDDCAGHEDGLSSDPPDPNVTMDWTVTVTYSNPCHTC